MTGRPDVVVGELDYGLLRILLDGIGPFDARKLAAARLEALLARCAIVPQDEVPPGVLTLYAAAELVAVEGGSRGRFSPVLPHDADRAAGLLSVLERGGRELLGRGIGDVVATSGLLGGGPCRVERVEPGARPRRPRRVCAATPDGLGGGPPQPRWLDLPFRRPV